MSEHPLMARGMIGTTMLDSESFMQDTKNMAINYSSDDEIAKAIRAVLETANRPAEKVDIRRIQILGMPGSGVEGFERMISSMVEHANTDPKSVNPNTSPSMGKK